MGSPLASITLWRLWLCEEIYLLISWRVILFHSSQRAFHNCSVLGFLALERPRVFHTFSTGLWGGQSITVTYSALRKFMTTIALWHGALSCMNMEGCLVEFLSTGKTWSFTSCLWTPAFTFPCNRTEDPTPSPNIIPQTMTLPSLNLTLALRHLGDNSLPTFLSQLTKT